MATFLADNLFKCIFLNENDRIQIHISLKFVPRSPIDNKAELVHWRIYVALWGDELTIGFNLLQTIVFVKKCCSAQHLLSYFVWPVRWNRFFKFTYPASGAGYFWQGLWPAKAYFDKYWVDVTTGWAISWNVISCIIISGGKSLDGSTKCCIPGAHQPRTFIFGIKSSEKHQQGYFRWATVIAISGS